MITSGEVIRDLPIFSIWHKKQSSDMNELSEIAIKFVYIMKREKTAFSKRKILKRWNQFVI